MLESKQAVQVGVGSKVDGLQSCLRDHDRKFHNCKAGKIEGLFGREFAGPIPGLKQNQLLDSCLLNCVYDICIGNDQ